MKETLSGIIIRTALTHGLQEMQDSPYRAVRKLVDMAEMFSAGGFQKQLFVKAQQLLENESSGYYILAQTLACNVEPERLLDYGMNIGFNGCIVGAERIRKIEKTENFLVPWSLSLMLPMDTFPEWENWYQDLISQGETLGIHCWVLFPDRMAQTALRLARNHPDSSFTLVCPLKTDFSAVMAAASQCSNIMLTVPYDAEADIVCHMLMEAKLLYGLYVSYGADHLEAIESGTLFREIEDLLPAACILIPTKDCDISVMKKVYSAVQAGRLSQRYHTLLLDWFYDTLHVDTIISENGCWAGFNENRDLIISHSDGRNQQISSEENSLKEMLQAVGWSKAK